MIVETELDALMLKSVLTKAVSGAPVKDQLALNAVTPLALGSATGGRHHGPTILGNAHRVFVALDADDPGDQASEWWIAKGAKRLRPAGAKDPGDMFKAGGADSVLTWVKSALA